MMRDLFLGLALAAPIAVAAPDTALACACCSNEGQRYVEVEKLDSGRLEQIESLRFAKEARLYAGGGGLEAIKGIQNPAERYDLKVTWDKSHASAGKIRLNFDLGNPGGRSGGLSLMLPQKISVFEVDPRDGSDQGTGPVLYKEWKLTGDVTAFGTFNATNDARQLLTLILQGRGNSCTAAADFTHWTLVTEGPKGTYSLFGALVR
jgi:hypothetical protein